MPKSLHDEIARKFDGEQAKRELFGTWLGGHPCPTWDDVERLLRELERDGRGREGAAEEVKETYLKSELPFHFVRYMCNTWKIVYNTLTLEKEREIVKEETALRKEKEAVCCYAVQGCIQSYNYIYRQPRRLRKPHAHTDRH